MATSLNDTQRLILAAAAARADRRALPFPDSLRAPPPAVTRTVQSLIRTELLAEIPADANDAVWREDDTGGRVTLVVTLAGLAAVGVEPEEGPTQSTAAAPVTAPPAPAEASPSKRSKQDIVVALLRSSTGASIKEMEAATGWQAHSVRGFMSGALKRRLKLDVVSVKDATGERRYQIAALRATKG